MKFIFHIGIAVAAYVCCIPSLGAVVFPHVAVYLCLHDGDARIPRKRLVSILLSTKT